MIWPPIISRVVRAMLRRMRSIRLTLAMTHPAPTQAVAKKRMGASVTMHRMLISEVADATGRAFPAVERRFSA